MIAYLALIIAVGGLLMYVLCANPKLVELGRIIFASGFFVFTWALGMKYIKLF